MTIYLQFWNTDTIAILFNIIVSEISLGLDIVRQKQFQDAINN